jgi:polyphosphate glucokinase
VARSPVLGIDVGGTGIKGAPVDVDRGALLADRLRILTPSPATPDAVADVVVQVARHFDWKGPVGICFPAAVKRGVTLSASNVDPAWINHDASRTFRLALGQPATVINDADAAGVAEMRFGAGRDERGTVVMLTLGTGVGCALFHGGTIFTNTELGHLPLRGKPAERRVSEAARLRRKISWKHWARDMNEYLALLESLTYPDLIILGGGAIKEAEHFIHRLQTTARLVPATLGNNAGIIGAAVNTADASRPARPARPARTPAARTARH